MPAATGCPTGTSGDLSLDTWVTDLETVVDAAGLDRFPLFAMSQGCAISVAFAVRHPERVSHLILYGGFARGAYKRAKNELELQKAKALGTLIRTGLGDDSPVFRQLFSSLFMPGGTKEKLEKFAERQRVTTSPECAYRYFETTRSLDVIDLLPKVTVPTLVMQCAATKCSRSRPAGNSRPGFPARGSWRCKDKTTFFSRTTPYRNASSKRSGCSSNSDPRRAGAPDGLQRSATRIAPAATSATPSQFSAESLSPRNSTPKTATSTTLNLSIGATCAALPSFSARK